VKGARLRRVMDIQIGRLDEITATRRIEAVDPAALIKLILLERTNVQTPRWG
jgi:hypothetical protein